MAQYSHLPIYNKAFTILRELYARVPGFGKQYKYSLGGKLIEITTEIIALIINANNEHDTKKREDRMEQLCTGAELLLTNLRIANELKQLGGQKSYLYLMEMMVDLSKQAEGWKKYVPGVPTLKV